MAKSKSRLGKGLAGLISGGANSATTTAAKKAAKKPAATKTSASKNIGGSVSKETPAAVVSPDFRKSLLGKLSPTHISLVANLMKAS